jgi:hypothetical protein
MSAPEPNSQLPQLPANLDDQAALDSWQRQWNAWIGEEAGRHNQPWFQPISPDTLREIVQEEKELRIDIARGEQQLEVETARVAMNQWEIATAAKDPQFEAKKAILIPLLKPILRLHVPPSKWKALFQEAYAQLQVPVSSSANEVPPEVTKAREVLNAIGQRLRAQDPAYEAKKSLLLPIIQPLFKQLPPSKWPDTFQEAYAGVRLPGESITGSASSAPVEPKGCLTQPKMAGAKELYALLPEDPKLVLLNWREIIKKITEEFSKTAVASQRDALLGGFTATMDLVSESLGPKKPEMIDDFRAARAQDYKLFIVEECLVGQHFNAKILCAVTRREIEAGRMAADCRPITDQPRSVVAAPDSTRRQMLNAQVDQTRHEILSGHTCKPRSGTLLLYKPDGHSDQIGISKIDPPVAGGAFFLDFTRPLKIIRRLLGRSNEWIGTAVELHVPIVHQNECKGNYEIHMYSSDPRFGEIRALWKARYPSAKTPPDTEAVGFKIVTDFATQFPGDC